MHAMKEVFVVMGETGEYSDREDWAVRAFGSQAEAEALVRALDEWLNEHHVSRNYGGQIDSDLRYGAGRLLCPLDPLFQLDYTGTRYYIITVPFGQPQAVNAVAGDSESARTSGRA
jgi:hypothetical protein